MAVRRKYDPLDEGGTLNTHASRAYTSTFTLAVWYRGFCSSGRKTARPTDNQRQITHSAGRTCMHSQQLQPPAVCDTHRSPSKALQGTARYVESEVRMNTLATLNKIGGAGGSSHNR